MADVKSGDVVVPGDQLCVIEELSPGFGTSHMRETELSLQPRQEALLST